MKRREFLVRARAAGASILVPAARRGSPPSAPAAPVRPNVLLLEIRNLAACPEEAGRVARMTAELKVRMKEAGDFCDLDKPHWN